jgi:hypothetical protein
VSICDTWEWSKKPLIDRIHDMHPEFVITIADAIFLYRFPLVRFASVQRLLISPV